MKIQLRRLSMSLGLSALLGGSLLLGQSNRATAEIPFDFTINGRVLEAGTYTVAQMSNGVLQLQNNDSSTRFMLLGILARSEKYGDPRLVFNRYGDTYFLSEVWMFDGIGATVPKSRQELALKAQKAPGVLSAIHLK